MELIDVINKRKSVRSFQKTEVPDLKELITLAGKCPSAGGIRGYEAIITKEKVTAQVDAPLYVVICTNPEAYVKRYGDRGKDLFSIQDATIFGAYLQLLLVDKGLSSVWIGAFREERVKKAIGTKLRPIAILCVGYGT